MADPRTHGRGLCGLDLCHSAHPQSVLPGVGSSRIACRSAAPAKRLDPCDRSDRAPVRRDAEGRSGRRALEHLCGPRRDPLLSAARRAIAAEFLCPGGDRRQGRPCARKGQSQARENSGGRVSECRHACLPAGAWPAGRLAGAVSRQRSRYRAGARDRLQAGASRVGQSAIREDRVRLDRAHTRNPNPHRSGSGADCWA